MDPVSCCLWAAPSGLAIFLGTGILFLCIRPHTVFIGLDVFLKFIPMGPLCVSVLLPVASLGSPMVMFVTPASLSPLLLAFYFMISVTFHPSLFLGTNAGNFRGLSVTDSPYGGASCISCFLGMHTQDRNCDTDCISDIS